MWRWMLASGLSLLLLGSAASAETTDARRAELHNLLVQDCGSCHGLTMRGGLGPALLPDNLVGKPRDMLVNTVMNGRPGTAMPPWDALLSREEAAWMIDRLRRGLDTP